MSTYFLVDTSCLRALRLKRRTEIRAYVSAAILHPDDRQEIEAKVAQEIDAAVAFAEAAEWEPVEDLTRDVITPAAELVR